jgi:hypothetical protein
MSELRDRSDSWTREAPRIVPDGRGPRDIAQQRASMKSLWGLNSSISSTNRRIGSASQSRGPDTAQRVLPRADDEGDGDSERDLVV